MEAGTADDAINPWGIALFRSLQTVSADTPEEEAAYGKWLDQTSDREEARRDRLHGAAGIIPDSLWLVLFLIAGIVFVYMLFFADSGERAVSQAMLVGSATAVVAATLLAIYALDNPYRPGVGSITPVAMERSLGILDEARAGPGRRRSAALRRLEEGHDDRSHRASAATVLLAVAAVMTAWCSYQATRWNGEQATASGRTNAIRIDAARAQGLSEAQAQIDVATFTQWVDAYARERRSWRTSTSSASAPSSSRPSTPGSRRGRLKNPDAPLTPFAMPQYRLAATAEAERLDAAAERRRLAVRPETSSAPPTTCSASSSARCRSSSPG